MWWHTRQHRWCKFYFGQLVWWQGSVVPPSLCWTGFSEEQMLNLTHCEREAASPLLSVEENICSTLTWKGDDRHLSSGVLSVTGEVLMWDHWRGLFFLTSSSYILIHNKEGKVFYLSTLLFLDALIEAPVLYTVERICWRILESVHSVCWHNGRKGEEMSLYERENKRKKAVCTLIASRRKTCICWYTLCSFFTRFLHLSLSVKQIYTHTNTPTPTHRQSQNEQVYNDWALRTKGWGEIRIELH